MKSLLKLILGLAIVGLMTQPGEGNFVLRKSTLEERIDMVEENVGKITNKEKYIKIGPIKHRANNRDYGFSSL